MGKKKKEILDAEFAPFHDGMVANGYSEESIQKLWEILVPFSDYAFNKAHATAYGVLTYWTAYLKANYPAQYMKALLGHEEDKDKHAEYRAEARRMGMTVLRQTNKSLQTTESGAVRHTDRKGPQMGPHSSGRSPESVTA